MATNDAVGAAERAGSFSNAQLNKAASLTDAQLLASGAFNQTDINAVRTEFNNRLTTQTGGVTAGTAPITPVTRTALAPLTPQQSVPKIDTRIRIRAQTAAKSVVYGNQSSSDNLLKILYDTNGMMFPYTPVITWTQNVTYTPLEMTHTNQDFYAYARTPSLEISINGEFTVQNQREGVYALACIHFLRTVSKMYFGSSKAQANAAQQFDPARDGRSQNVGNTGGSAGLPPPVLLLSGYGNYMFNDLRVIVKSHTYTLDKTADMIDVKTAGGLARLPAIFTIGVSLIVQNTPNRWRAEFNLDDFREGKLMRNGKSGWI